MNQTLQTLLLGAGFGAAFLIGQCFPRAAGDSNPQLGHWQPGRWQPGDWQPGDWQPGHLQIGQMGADAGAAQSRAGNLVLDAQGRGPVSSPPPAPDVPADTDANAGNNGIVYTEESSTAASANGFLAVTGSYGVGTSVLYLIDTENRQMACYEARGGAAGQRRIVMVGARRIDLDLKLHGYNDRSEFEYSDLEKLFDKRGKKDPSVNTGLNPKGRSDK
jgi:hypothetical protein